MSLILRSYFEELVLIICVFFLGVCAIIFTSSFAIDNKEEKCVDFYLKNNYITKSCEVYRYKLEVINEKDN